MDWSRKSSCTKTKSHVFLEQIPKNRL